ncbi:MAG: TonB-dependent receptor family protein [Lysobacter sp.]
MAIGLALVSGHVFADETDGQDKATTLDAIVVQGNVIGASRPEEVRTYAGSRKVIGHDELANGGNRSLDDALQRVPGVKILDETGTGVLPQIMLRGLYESRSGRVQTLLDGIPLSLAPYGQTSISLFPVTMSQIDRVDIVRGGAAVQYGPNNVGGVINFVSKPIPAQWTTVLGQKITGAGDGKYLYDSVVSTGGYLSPNFGLQLDANRIHGDYFRDHSATDVTNLRLRAEWWLADDKVLKGDVQRYIADMDMAGALSVADYRRDSRQATRPLDHFSGSTTRGSLTYVQDIGAWGPFDQSQFSWTNFAQRSERNFVVGMRRLASETWRSDLPPQLRQNAPRSFKVYGSQPQINLHLSSDTIEQQWTAGVRAVREDIDFLVENTGLDNGAYTLVRDWRFEDRAWAAYVSDAIDFRDIGLTVTPGLRYERLDSTYFDRAKGTRIRNEVHNLLPGLTVGYQASERWNLYADAQRSLRAPQVTQIVFGGNVDSELAWNYEAGARYATGNGTHVDFGLYRIDFDDQILLDNTTRTYRNIGKTRHQGVEIESVWALPGVPGLSLNASYAYLDSEQRSGAFRGNDVPYASRHQVNAGATYVKGETSLALSGYYYSKSFSDAANTVPENAVASVGELPSYAVWNAQITHSLLKRGDSSLKGSLAVNNLFNRQYWFRGIDTSPWGRQPAPGRSVTVGLEFSF